MPYAFATHLPLPRAFVSPCPTRCHVTPRKIRASQSPPPPPPPSSRDDDQQASNGGDDWDKAWAEFSRTLPQKSGVSGGGTFGISEAKSSKSPVSNDYRAENRAADAFSSEAFFLGGAIVIGLVAVFYAFVLLGPQ